MARPLRIEFSGAVYHVTSRGNARNDIYRNDDDRKAFLSILADISERYNWLCHAYCLMGNHYHLLIETVDPTLSLGMRQLNGIYTQVFNRKHSQVGHLFQGRYKSILVEKESYLLELCRYIVLNPVAAGIVNRPEEWQWSSFRATSGLVKEPDFLVSDWILNQFSQQKKVARQHYINFVRDGLNLENKTPWTQLRGQIFLGSTQFVSGIEELLGEKKDLGEIPREQRYPGRPPLAEIFLNVVDKKDRNEKIRKAHRTYGYTLQQIANALKLHYSTVSLAAKQPGQTCHFKT